MYHITVNFTFFNIYDIVNLNIFNTLLTMLNNFYFNLVILIYFSLCFINIQKSNKLFIILFLFLISASIKYKYILSNFFFGFYKIHPPLLYIVLMFFFYLIIKRNKILKHNYQKVFNLIVLTFI